MKKKLCSFVVAAVLAAGSVGYLPGVSLPYAQAVGVVTRTSGCESSYNVIDTSTHYYDNQDKTVKSYLYQSGDNTLTRVEYTNSKIIAEDIDMTTGKLIKSREIKMELPIFGGFYVGKDYLFVVTGQKNPDESNDQKILAVTRITKDFKSYKMKYLMGRNTYIPFDAGSCRMTEAGGKLYVHTCHEMYQSSDGYHHQANMSYVFDIDTLAVEQDHYSVSWPYNIGYRNDAFGYSSHSFDQFIVSDDTAVYAYDHGDAYTRALRLHKYTLSDGYLDYSDVVKIPGEEGDNYTSVLTGSMVLSKSNVLIGVKMADMSGGSLDNYGDLKDIYIIVTPKDSIGESSPAKLVNLTNYTDKKGSEKRNSAPKIVKVNDNKFIVLWKEIASSTSGWEYDYSTGKWSYKTTDNGAVTKIAVIDGSGNLKGKVMSSADIALSDCDPVLCSDGMIRWYTANDSEPVIYALDPNDPSEFTSSRTPGDADGDGNVDVSDVLLIQQKIAGWDVKINESNADVDGNKKIDVSDALLVQQKIAGWDVDLV